MRHHANHLAPKRFCYIEIYVFFKRRIGEHNAHVFFVMIYQRLHVWRVFNSQIILQFVQKWGIHASVYDLVERFVGGAHRVGHVRHDDDLVHKNRYRLLAQIIAVVQIIVFWSQQPVAKLIDCFDDAVCKINVGIVAFDAQIDQQRIVAIRGHGQ